LNSESARFRGTVRFSPVACRTSGEAAGRLFLVFGDQAVPHSISDEIEEICNAFPAMLDCATCGTPQPMKIDRLLRERGGDRKTVVYRCTACGGVRDREARLAASSGQR
jgi:hypothetical protein